MDWKKLLEKIPVEKRLGFGLIVGTTFGMIITAIAVISGVAPMTMPIL